jgi:hypothetical protein
MNSAKTRDWFPNPGRLPDAFGDPGKFGKEPWGDIRTNKKTSY